MKGSSFPIFKTKIKGITDRFDLNDPKGRAQYFRAKAGPEIEKLKKYLENNTFIAYLLGKKNSGKGTYAKLFMEIISPTKVGHISIGDIVRDVHQSLAVPSKKRKLLKFLRQHYRGYIPLEKALKDLVSRDIKTLQPTEFILTLVKREISLQPKKALFIDGFPRNLDQISYSLYFRDLIDYRDDPDIFVLIDVPEQIINERMKYRVVCPSCQTPRNTKLLPTKEVAFNKRTKKFELLCDNPQCKKTKMVQKEGDTLGIEAIRERLEMDEKLIKQALSLYGIPKILLRNSVPVELAPAYIDDYEITPEYSYQWNADLKKVEIKEKPWLIRDEEGVLSYSLLPSPVVLSLIKQLVDVLGLK